MKWYRSGKYITLIIQCQKHARNQFQMVWYQIHMVERDRPNILEGGKKVPINL